MRWNVARSQPGAVGLSCAMVAWLVAPVMAQAATI